MARVDGQRQGLMEAQRYPQDYDGIVSGAPAINWTKFLPQELWGAVLMNATGNPLPACKLAAAATAAIAACDGIDGVKDGVIADPHRCAYDPKPLIGTSSVGCGPFTEADADAIRKAGQGPLREDGSFLWYELPRGADLNALCGPDKTNEPLEFVPAQRGRWPQSKGDLNVAALHKGK